MFGSTHVPFGERGGRARGALDLLAGHYPAFTVGGSVGRLLPVFHFHETTPATLEPKLQYLAENGYRTVTSPAVTAPLEEGVRPPPSGPRSTMGGRACGRWQDRCCGSTGCRRSSTRSPRASATRTGRVRRS